jgi:predicted RNA-binding protein with PUA-like domain
MKRYWLMKTEPSTFSWGDLLDSPGKTTPWDGVRNYRARNFMRDEMRKGDGVLFYHSNAKPPAVVGTATVSREGYPDPTQFDPKSPYYDPKADPENPRWFLVDVRADRGFKREVPLPELRETPGLEDMALLRRGMRLSVQPVTSAEWRIILKLGGVKA